MKKRIFKFVLIGCAVILALGVILLVLVWNGVIILNAAPACRYPIRGVDVSSYQGQIDWQVLSSQDLSFAFIKATEGSTFVDRKFFDNYEAAKKTGLAICTRHIRQ